MLNYNNQQVLTSITQINEDIIFNIYPNKIIKNININMLNNTQQGIVKKWNNGEI